MTKTMQVEIVSAEKAIFSGEATHIVATGLLGELGIYPGHTQLLTALKPGPVRIVKPNGKVICFGWNSNGVGKTRGFDMEKILLIAHGSRRNDTIVTVETKLVN